MIFLPGLKRSFFIWISKWHCSFVLKTQFANESSALLSWDQRSLCQKHSSSVLKLAERVQVFACTETSLSRLEWLMSMHLAMCETTAHAFFVTSSLIHQSMSDRASNSLTASWALLYFWRHHCESTEQIQFRLNRSHFFEQLDSLRSYLCSSNSSLATVQHCWSLLFTQNSFQVQTFCSSHRW